MKKVFLEINTCIINMFSASYFVTNKSYDRKKVENAGQTWYNRLDSEQTTGEKRCGPIGSDVMEYNIAICDDAEGDRVAIAGMVRRWAEAAGYGARIDEFLSAEGFLFEYDRKKDYDILLLDVEMRERVYTVKESITALGERLSDDFYRAHRSYIVNLKAVERISRTDVTVEGGARIPLSRGKYDDVNRAFIERN